MYTPIIQITDIHTGAKMIGNPRCLQTFTWGSQSGYKLPNPSIVFPVTTKLNSGITIITFGKLLYLQKTTVTTNARHYKRDTWIIYIGAKTLQIQDGYQRLHLNFYGL